MNEEAIFKALADDSRRSLLDALFERDGQTLTELCERLPMSRFGVMKHLDLLEDAGLIETRKVGREKFHYLNPTPIQQVYDRWVSKFAQPWAQALTGLKYALEDPAMNAPSHVYSIVIRTTPERLWHALTDGDMSQQYYFGTRVESSWALGAPYTYRDADGAVVAGGGVMIEGEVIESDPPRKLVTTFMPRWLEGPLRDQSSRVTFEIEPLGAVCKLTLTHEDLGTGHVGAGIINGWALILSSLKSLLETGEALPVTPMGG